MRELGMSPAPSLMAFGEPHGTVVPPQLSWVHPRCSRWLLRQMQLRRSFPKPTQGCRATDETKPPFLKDGAFLPPLSTFAGNILGSISCKQDPCRSTFPVAIRLLSPTHCCLVCFAHSLSSSPFSGSKKEGTRKGNKTRED